MTRPLAACGQYECPDSLEGLLKEFLGEYTAILPLPVLGVFVFGGIALASYIETDSVVIPTGYVMLTGGAALSYLAPPGYQIATLLVLFVSSGAVTLMWYVYST